MKEATDRQAAHVELALPTKAKRAECTLRKCRARNRQNSALGSYELLDSSSNPSVLSHGSTGCGVSLAAVADDLSKKTQVEGFREESFCHS